MPISVLCITDPQSHPSFDTTVDLYRRLVSDLRFSLSHTNATSISACWGSPRLEVPAVRVETPLTYEQFLELSLCTGVPRAINEFDFVFHRTDKPFPPHFLDQLEVWESLTCMANSPKGLRQTDNREFAEKHFSHCMPSHVVTTNFNVASSFIEQHRSVVAKENVSYGGKGISRIYHHMGQWQLERSSGDLRRFDDLSALLRHLPLSSDAPMEFVRFLKNVNHGDKRVLVVGGEIVGAYLRKSKDSGWIQNVTHGGECVACTIGTFEYQCINETYPHFESRGVYTLGYDFLMDDDGSWVLSEVNVGNIGGYNRLEPLYGIDGFSFLFDWIESRVATHRASRG